MIKLFKNNFLRLSTLLGDVDGRQSSENRPLAVHSESCGETMRLISLLNMCTKQESGDAEYCEMFHENNELISAKLLGIYVSFSYSQRVLVLDL